MDLRKKITPAACGMAIVFVLTIPLLTAAQVMKDNVLSKEEAKQGWVLLFDGKTTTGWHTYNKPSAGAAWKVQDASLTLDGTDASGGGGDIVTEKTYGDFELELDWKIEPCGNSGIIFNVVEDVTSKETYYTGPEIQVLDNCHPDGKIPRHRAGNLYDLVASKTESVKPGNEWNHYRIVSKKGNLQVWLNDIEQFQIQMFTPEWEALISKSKFKDMPDFGKAQKGKIALQDHGNRVSYKNIKIKEL